MLFSLSFMSQVVRYERTSLVEQTEAHVLILRLLLLLLLSGGWRISSGWCVCRSNWSSGGDGEHVLVAVDKRVHDGWEGWVAGREGDGSDGRDGGGEGLEQLRLLDVENGGLEGLAVVVNLSNTHTVREGGDVQHVEQGGLGGTDLGASLDELEIRRDFDGTTGNLGGHTESLEERRLARFHTRVTGWDVDINWRNGTGTSWSSDTVGENLVTDLLQVLVGKDEADVAADVGEETLELGHGAVVDEGLNGAADHGVLAHQDDTLSTEGDADLVHLLGRDIVDGDDEDGLVSLKESLELIEVSGLCSFGDHCECWVTRPLVCSRRQPGIFKPPC